MTVSGDSQKDCQKNWQRKSARRLEKILKTAQTLGLSKKIAPNKTLFADLTFVSATKMKKMNLKYRKKNRVTDVLSFESPLVFQKEGILGELVICESQLKKQAKEWKNTVEAERDLLLVHGVLHLLGLDHEKSVSQAKKMAKLEKKILGLLKIKKTSSLIARVNSD